MKCQICGGEIRNKDDVHFLDELMVCTDCYDKETDEAKLE